MLVLLSLRVSGGVDALGRRKACCRRAVTLVDLLLLLCATRKDCSLLCAMHETIVVFTSGLFADALGIWKLLDLSTEWRRVRQCVWRARGARTQDTLIALSGRQYH